MDKIYNVLLDALMCPEDDHYLDGVKITIYKTTHDDVPKMYFEVDDEVKFDTERAYERIEELLKKEEKE